MGIRYPPYHRWYKGYFTNICKGFSEPHLESFRDVGVVLLQLCVCKLEYFFFFLISSWTRYIFLFWYTDAVKSLLLSKHPVVLEVQPMQSTVGVWPPHHLHIQLPPAPSLRGLRTISWSLVLLWALGQLLRGVWYTFRHTSNVFSPPKDQTSTPSPFRRSSLYFYFWHIAGKSSLK